MLSAERRIRMRRHNLEIAASSLRADCIERAIPTVRTLLLVCTVLATTIRAAGCGGGNSPGTSVTGNVNGRSFAAKDAIATHATGSGFTFGGPAAYIEITDYALACADETAGQQPATGQRLLL
ncbi:MAG TPA: hypothetical protein VG496_07070, partial [Myxococcales bacterium]|nr:hypothetical protein [Myxococcales bacterium]